MSGDNDSRSYYQRHRHAPHGRIRIVKVHPFRQYALSYPVYSAFGTRQHRFKIAGLDYGADAYIEKPFSLSHMKATINNLLENRRMLFNHFTTVPNMSYDQTLMNKTDVKWLNTINEIITRNFTNEEFTIDKMAEEMAVSRSNLQRKLKGLTGMPPNDYIRLIRLKTAGELLREGEYRINEVCYIVGFNNPSYFARCFQKQFGILPKDYVKKGS